MCNCCNNIDIWIPDRILSGIPHDSIKLVFRNVDFSFGRPLLAGRTFKAMRVPVHAANLALDEIEIH
jgi:hypothetical protein